MRLGQESTGSEGSESVSPGLSCLARDCHASWRTGIFQTSTFTGTRFESITLRGPSTAQQIIVALDGSALSARALPVGVHLARQRQSPLTLVRVAPLDPPPDMFGFAVGDYSCERDFAGAYIDRLVERTHKDNPDVQLRGDVLSGGASRSLLEAEAVPSPQLTIITRLAGLACHACFEAA